ncbi:MAG TPA: cytochrome d ubiquinol oxidase subunit II [Bryobacteraceae bacterium]|jgi:cytochrome d ubiquinol oxidase subunit II
MGDIWYWLVALMLAAYVVLDGFDIGAGIIHLLLSKGEEDRQLILRSIGPVWDGNEVWLIAMGGTLYFAFPFVYASALSGFYLPLMIVLWLLVLRGIGIELRMHLAVRVWREFFDGCFAISSSLLAIFLGVILANVFRGAPIGNDGYFFLPLWTNFRPGTNPGIFDWYTLTGSLLALVALAVHGAFYVAFKTEDSLHDRAAKLGRRLLGVLVVMTLVGLAATLGIRPSAPGNYFHHPVAFLIPLLVVASLMGMLMFSRAGRDREAFLSSCSYLAAVLIGAAVSLFPILLPSSTDPTRDITISRAMSGSYALSAGLIWWAIGILCAIGYFVFVYRMFAGKVRLSSGDASHD